MKLLPISKSNNHELLAFQTPRVEGYEINNSYRWFEAYFNRMIAQQTCFTPTNSCHARKNNPFILFSTIPIFSLYKKKPSWCNIQQKTLKLKVTTTMKPQRDKSYVFAVLFCSADEFN